MDLGQRLPMCQPFRASWQMAARPCLSFPPPPLKFRTVGFPQYGFKLACAAAIFPQQLPAVIVRHGTSVQTRLSASRSPGFRPGGTMPSLPRTASPVALGSPSGCAVRPTHRLLRPHPSFCPPPPVSLDYASGCDDEQKFPNLLCQGLIPCRRPCSGGSRAPMTSLRACFNNAIFLL